MGKLNEKVKDYIKFGLLFTAIFFGFGRWCVLLLLMILFVGLVSDLMRNEFELPSRDEE